MISFFIHELTRIPIVERRAMGVRRRRGSRYYHSNKDLDSRFRGNDTEGENDY